MPTLVAYISGHGFGHASRTVELLRALASRDATLQLHVRSQVAPWLIERTAPPAVELTPVVCDTGAIQADSLTLDVDETLRRAVAFTAEFGSRVEAEARALSDCGATLVVADIPPLGVAAAQAAGVPAVMLGNFTWDWIYAAYPGGAAVAEAAGRVYRTADLALRLPLHGGFATCTRIVDLPFIARRSLRTPDEVRRALGLPLGLPLVLVSFGGFGITGLDLEEVNRVTGYGVIVSGLASATRPVPGSLIPLDEDAMYARGFRYEDIVRAVDVVVTKPGYGIIAEAIANDTALLYTSRGDFAEYDVLVDGMPRYLRCGFIDQAELLAGRWQAPLDALMDQPPPRERPRVDGAEVAAGLLLDMM